MDWPGHKSKAAGTGRGRETGRERNGKLRTGNNSGRGSDGNSDGQEGKQQGQKGKPGGTGTVRESGRAWTGREIKAAGTGREIVRKKKGRWEGQESIYIFARIFIDFCFMCTHVHVEHIAFR